MKEDKSGYKIIFNQLSNSRKKSKINKAGFREYNQENQSRNKER
jgi:hypothetical protein